MTDRQSNDVLDKVRMLVAKHGAAVSNAEALQPDIDERLILTPSLRVSSAAIDFELQAQEPQSSLTQGCLINHTDHQVGVGPNAFAHAEGQEVTMTMKSDSNEPFNPFAVQRESDLDAGDGNPVNSVNEPEVRGHSVHFEADRYDSPEHAANLDEQLDGFLSDDHILADAGLDEDRLRLMISEIIKDELQGAIGERVTRNIRKLVRQEIARSLAQTSF